MKVTKIVLFVLFVLFQRSTADNLYCEDGGIVQFEMDSTVLNDQTLIPWGVDDQQSDKPKPRSCSWKIKQRSARRNLQMILIGLSSPEDESVIGTGGALDNFFEVSTKGTRISISAGTIHALPLAEARQLNVETQTRDSSSGRLRILVPLPGVCSRDMLSFRGNCYAVTTALQTTKQVVSSVGGSAQLASFSSMAQIREFIRANTGRMSEFPYTRPLDLKQPLRLGMFLSAAAVLSAVRDESGCKLVSAVNASDFRAPSGATVQCASLRVTERDEAVVEFGDCSRPMLSLLSFPETTASRSARRSAQCNGDQLARLVEQLRMRDIPEGASTTPSAAAGFEFHKGLNEGFLTASTQTVVFAAAGAVICLLTVASAVAAVLIRRQRRRKRDSQDTPAVAVLLSDSGVCERPVSAEGDLMPQQQFVAALLTGKPADAKRDGIEHLYGKLKFNANRNSLHV